MERKEAGIARTDGLVDNTPLGARIGIVKVAIRPPDPMLLEKIQTGLKELKDKGIVLPESASMAVRSIDGFYYFRDLKASMGPSEADLVSIVNYDPVRRTFILSGNGTVDDVGELFWFAFEAFDNDHVLFREGKGETHFRSPDDMDQRVEMNLGILRSWKEEHLVRIKDQVLWRGPDLDSFLRMIEAEYGRSDHSVSQ